MIELFKKAIVAKFFFEVYAPGIKNFKHKLRGVDGNKKPIDFNDAEKSQIRAGLKKLFKDLS